MISFLPLQVISGLTDYENQVDWSSSVSQWAGPSVSFCMSYKDTAFGRSHDDLCKYWGKKIH